MSLPLVLTLLWFVAANLLVDLAYGLLDPRVGSGRGGAR